MSIKRGEIWLANLDPSVGSEIRKTRPVLIISNDINNMYNNVVTAIPITSNTDKVFSFEVFIPIGEAQLPKDSKVKTDQIRTIDKIRLIKKIGTLSPKYLQKIEKALTLHLGL